MQRDEIVSSFAKDFSKPLHVLMSSVLSDIILCEKKIMSFLVNKKVKEYKNIGVFPDLQLYMFS